MDVEALSRDILAGKFLAVARGITLVENDLPEKEELVGRIFPNTGGAIIIGITGAPGSGKSTLVDRLIQSYRDRGKRVGVVAVDPSSPFTQGAILGDRLRMQTHVCDPGVFIRSMATRGRMGGLSSGCRDAVKILDAAGFDYIIVETVGVGQTEVDIIRLTDLALLVLTPGMGDEIQALKAGVMEIGDIFVVNKKDIEGADRLKAEVEYVMGLSASESGKKPIVMVSAKNNEGVDELLETMDNLVKTMKENGALESRRKRIAAEELLQLIRDKMHRLIETHIVTPESLEVWAEEITSGKKDPYAIVNERVTPRLTLC